MKVSFASMTLKIWFRNVRAARTAPAAGIVTFIACTGFPQTRTDLGTILPAPAPYDLSQPGTIGNQTFPDELNYHTDNCSNHGADERGQMFATGTNADGYGFASLIIRTAGLSPSSRSIQPVPIHRFYGDKFFATLFYRIKSIQQTTN
jgi:hypothetical protein